MHALSATELLSVWESGAQQTPHERALYLLTMACRDQSPDELAALTIGRRDARLLTLREWTFGTELNALMTCPACGQGLELNFNAAEIRIAPGASSLSETETVSTDLSLVLDDYEVHFRLPNSLDLAALAPLASTAAFAGRQELLKRCVLSAHYHDADADVENLPDEVLEAIALRMEVADPQADVRLNSRCLACSHEWQSIFDIESFFWSEIKAWAERVLREVHTLARVYCWREADILAMSPQRRQFYLDLLSG